MFFSIIKATMKITILEILFKYIIHLPVLSTVPTVLPKIANKINQSHEIKIVDAVKINLSNPS